MRINKMPKLSCLTCKNIWILLRDYQEVLANPEKTKQYDRLKLIQIIQLQKDKLEVQLKKVEDNQPNFSIIYDEDK